LKTRLRLTQQPALDGAKLPDSYRLLFQLWSVITVAGLSGMIAIMALMIWQPHWA